MDAKTIQNQIDKLNVLFLGVGELKYDNSSNSVQSSFSLQNVNCVPDKKEPGSDEPDDPDS